jgi:hypothetical protein
MEIPVVSIILLILAVFFISSALIMVTYNNSIVNMNPSWKKINYTDSMIFTLFLIFAGNVFSPSYIKNINSK